MSTPLVTYRRLGRSGLRVSVPILGTAGFGSKEWEPWVIDKTKALPILKAAWDLGINTIDTANVYSNGESERIIASFMKEYNIPRHKLVILTKCQGLVGETPEIITYRHPHARKERDYQNQYGLSRTAIFNAVEASLARLETSYIDLLQIHRFDPDTEMEETMKALHDLVQAGKVRYIGASSIRTWRFVRMNHIADKNGWTRFVSMQGEYSLLYREEEREMNPYCDFEGIGLIPWATLAAGVLARPVSAVRSTVRGQTRTTGLSKVEEEIVNRVEELANKKGWSMAQVALVWSISRVSSPIVGINAVDRLKDTLVSDKSLTREECRYLEEPYQPKRQHGKL